MSEEEQSSEKSPSKRVAKKVHYPFGTPSHQYHAYSTYIHVKKEDYLLFHALSTSQNITPEIVSGEEEKIVTKNPRENVKIEVNAEALKDLPSAAEGVEPCKRLDCKTVVRMILESQSRSRIERDDISADIDTALRKTQELEQENVNLEGKVSLTNRVNEQLEATLSHLSANIVKLEASKLELQHEREEFTNKMMVTETEKQSWLRQLQIAEKAHADAMWRGKTDSNSTTAGVIKKPDLEIKRKSSRFVDDAHSVANTTYGSLGSVRGGVVDYSEMPGRSITSSVPDFLKTKLLPPKPSIPLTQNTSEEVSVMMSSSRHSGSWSAQSKLFTHHSRKTIRYQGSTVATLDGSAHLTPLELSSSEKAQKRVNKLHKDSSNPFLQLPPGAYVGYTPSGSPRNRSRSGGGALSTREGLMLEDDHTFRSTRSNGGSPSIMSGVWSQTRSLSSLGVGDMSAGAPPVLPARQWQQLDPIFFDIDAVSTFSRGDAVGRQRIKDPHAPAGQFTQMMTFKHPGLPRGITKATQFEGTI